MQEVGAVQNKKSLRLRASFVLCAAVVLMIVAVRGSFAAGGREDNIDICHATNSVENPYLTSTIDADGGNGNADNDHTSHVGPVASSPEVAQQLKDDHIDWGDIIPPYGDFPGLNWDADGQAIWENGCTYPAATDDDSGDDSQDDSSDAPADDSSDAPADDSSDAPADDSSDAPADDSSDAPADDSSDAPADDSSDAPADDSSDDGVLADDSVADDGSTPTDDGSEGDVLGRTVTRPLAQTGPETTVLALIGFAMLLAGAAMRFGRFGSREVFATASISQSPADLLAKALQARSRHWTCSK